MELLPAGSNSVTLAVTGRKDGGLSPEQADAFLQAIAERAMESMNAAAAEDDADPEMLQAEANDLRRQVSMMERQVADGRRRTVIDRDDGRLTQLEAERSRAAAERDAIEQVLGEIGPLAERRLAALRDAVAARKQQVELSSGLAEATARADLANGEAALAEAELTRGLPRDSPWAEQLARLPGLEVRLLTAQNLIAEIRGEDASEAADGEAVDLDTLQARLGELQVELAGTERALRDASMRQRGQPRGRLIVLTPDRPVP